MLCVDASDEILNKWRKSIEHYYAMHLSGFTEHIKTIRLSIEEQPLYQKHGILYCCRLNLVPKSGHVLSHSVDREDCIAAIDYSFAKAKRMLQRRMRGLSKGI